MIDDQDDDLTPEKRARLHAAIDRGIEDAAGGPVTPIAGAVTRQRGRR